jgi:YHS domain-containing protein
VDLFIQIHEGEIFDKAEMVEDPVAKISFPRFAAAATLEQGGKTYFFIDEQNKTEFVKKAAASA